MDSAFERRKFQRFPVTLSASVCDAERRYRVSILDVSAGGLLLSAPEDLRVEPGTALTIEAAMIGRLEAHVVARSEHGIHLEVRDNLAHYEDALSKLSRRTVAWR